MWVMCSTICAEVLEAPVYKGFLDTQDDTDLIHSEVLLIKKGWYPSLQVRRNGMRRHYLITMYVHSENRTQRQSRALVIQCRKNSRFRIHMKGAVTDLSFLQRITCYMDHGPFSVP